MYCVDKFQKDVLALSSSDRLEGQGVGGGQTDRLNIPVDLFVRNLSFKTTEEQLKKFFEQYGEVQYAEVPFLNLKIMLVRRQREREREKGFFIIYPE